ncbi:ROK family protein [candidate division KSB1 bacterium]|nr:ROK family protein [candidate division KSB1 bacterium]
MNLSAAISLDVGGTSIKSALVTENGQIVTTSYHQDAINSKGTASEIIDTLLRPMIRLFALAQRESIEVVGMGIGIPGPFDCERGISLIQGVDKYEAIYGLNLRQEFRQRLGLAATFPILFEFDSWVFLRGEAWQGAGQGFSRLIGLTLGTGFGSAFMIAGEPVGTGPGVPPLAWIGGLPYRDGLLDDMISRRGILRHYAELTGQDTPALDVGDIAARAYRNEPAARQVFEAMGAFLGHALIPLVQAFQAEAMIVGGKIAKSFTLFNLPLEAEFNRAQLPITIRPASNIDQSAVLGAGQFLWKHYRQIPA